MDPLTIQYRYTLKDQSVEKFRIDLDPQRLTMISTPHAHPLPSWTRLEYFQCSHCRLLPDDFPECPVAENLVFIVERLGRLISYDRVDVEVQTPDRRVYSRTTAQQGISSMMGLVIAASKCPYTDFLKPMAWFHLPFANEVETVWRATATYLMAQYLLTVQGNRVELDLDGMTRIYHDIEKLNRTIVKRLRVACDRDSTVNALVHLDVFAKHLTPGLAESMDRLRHFFDPFLKNPHNM